MRGIKAFILVEFLDYLGSIRKLKDLSNDYRATFSQHSSRIFSEVIEAPVNLASSDCSQPSNDWSYFGGSMLRQQRSVRK